MEYMQFLEVLLSTVAFNQTRTNPDDLKEMQSNTVTIRTTAEWLPDTEDSLCAKNCAEGFCRQD